MGRGVCGQQIERCACSKRGCAAKVSACLRKQFFTSFELLTVNRLKNGVGRKFSTNTLSNFLNPRHRFHVSL